MPVSAAPETEPHHSGIDLAHVNDEQAASYQVRADANTRSTRTIVVTTRKPNGTQGRLSLLMCQLEASRYLALQIDPPTKLLSQRRHLIKTDL
jgi:hypothetical protein